MLARGGRVSSAWCLPSACGVSGRLTASPLDALGRGGRGGFVGAARSFCGRKDGRDGSRLLLCRSGGSGSVRDGRSRNSLAMEAASRVARRLGYGAQDPSEGLLFLSGLLLMRPPTQDQASQLREVPEYRLGQTPGLDDDGEKSVDGTAAGLVDTVLAGTLLETRAAAPPRLVSFDSQQGRQLRDIRRPGSDRM